MQKYIFSAPGRVELSGNHTDHQNGRVLAAAIDLEACCIAEANGTDFVQLTSDGFGDISVDLTVLEPCEAEKETVAALIRGVAAWFVKNGYKISGFNGHVASQIPVGSGLSSSAAFEVLIGNVFKGLFGLNVSPLDIALAGQFAENKYFGKPCGLMDQAASSLGGLMLIDFCAPLSPVIIPIQADFKGYSLCVIDAGGSHANLTDDYALIPAEMKKIASHFGKKVLREVCPNEFYESIGSLRAYGDRAVLRAMHFFEENERVLEQALALEAGDISEFLRLTTESGKSSLAYLQNVYQPNNPSEQGLTLALSLCERFLGTKGAYRVHGGGFAGTVLAFVPKRMKQGFENSLQNVFGKKCCRFLNIREAGGGKGQDIE